MMGQRGYVDKGMATSNPAARRVKNHMTCFTLDFIDMNPILC
jgi:hypothetical protein